MLNFLVSSYKPPKSHEIHEPDKIYSTNLLYYPTPTSKLFLKHATSRESESPIYIAERTGWAEFIWLIFCSKGLVTWLYFSMGSIQVCSLLGDRNNIPADLGPLIQIQTLIALLCLLLFILALLAFTPNKFYPSIRVVVMCGSIVTCFWSQYSLIYIPHIVGLVMDTPDFFWMLLPHCDEYLLLDIVIIILAWLTWEWLL